MATAPHSLATESAVAVLREGGNALEAMIAAAATISVVYPHMNGIGGDSFWLIHEPGKPVTTIDACGPAAMAASRDWYAERLAGTDPKGLSPKGAAIGASPECRSGTDPEGLSPKEAP